MSEEGKRSNLLTLDSLMVMQHHTYFMHDWIDDCRSWGGGGGGWLATPLGTNQTPLKFGSGSVRYSERKCYRKNATLYWEKDLVMVGLSS